MKVVACLTRFRSEWKSLLGVMDGMSLAVVCHHSPDELLQSLGPLDPDLFLVDARTPKQDLETLVDLASPSATLIVASPPPQPGDTRLAHVEDAIEVYDTLLLSDRPARLRKVLLRSVERSSLVQKDVRLVHSQETTAVSTVPTERRSQRPWEMALRSLSRTLSAGLDSRELIEPFMDLAMELSGVARSALITPDPGTAMFRVSASRGLHGQVLRAYPHSRKSGLIAMLVNEGRPLRRDDPVIRQSVEAQEIQRSFDALQATVCIPMAARGALLGVLALGTRISGQPPMDEQLEILFTIGSHVAVALQNAMLHEEMTRQKIQGETVLEHMTNGVASIDEAGTITVFNRRVAEVLDIAADSVLGRDLRCLPAPLGDFLYGALHSGEATRPTELTLAGSGTAVEVSTFPVFAPGLTHPVGSVLLLEDTRERRALAESRSHADKQDVFNRLVSQLAHEMKNPLVAVKTFADLFAEHWEDPEFIGFIRTSVIPEIRRLDEIGGKLVDFLNPAVLELRSYPLAEILEDLVERATPEAAGFNVTLALTIGLDLPHVRADRGMLCKGLYYLLRHLIANVPHAEGAAVTVAASSLDGHSPRAIIEFSCDRPWTGQDDIEHLFDPLYVTKERLNLALPVARKIIQEHRGDVEAVVKPKGIVDLRVTLQATEGPPALVRSSADIPPAPVTVPV